MGRPGGQRTRNRRRTSVGLGPADSEEPVPLAGPDEYRHCANRFEAQLFVAKIATPRGGTSSGTSARLWLLERGRRRRRILVEALGIDPPWGEQIDENETIVAATRRVTAT